MAKGISRVPLSLARLNEEDLVDIRKLALRHSQKFDLPEPADQSEVDMLNQAFSSLVLRQGEISPNRKRETDGSVA